MTNEIIRGMGFEEYLAIPALNASSIKAGAKSMLHMHAAMEGKLKFNRATMRFGTLAHARVFEPETFHAKKWTFEGFTNQGKPTTNKNSSAYAEAVEEHGGDEWCMTPEQMESMEIMVQRVFGDPETAAMLSGGIAESVLLWDDPECGPSKARLDYYVPGKLLADLKTTANIDERKFANLATDLKYHWQFGWYRRGLRFLEGRDIPCKLICLEQGYPHDVVPYKIIPEILAEGERKAVEKATLYRECEQAGVFPGIAAGGVIEMKWPGYAYGDDEVTMKIDGVEVPV